jgi:hypothetical protein
MSKTTAELEPLFSRLDSAIMALRAAASEARADEVAQHCAEIVGVFEQVGKRLSSTLPLAEQFPHYYRTLPTQTVDVYRILDAFGVHRAAVQHAIKKLFACGRRGAKDRERDLKEARDSITRELEMLAEDAEAREAPFEYVSRETITERAGPPRFDVPPSIEAGALRKWWEERQRDSIARAMRGGAE